MSDTPTKYYRGCGCCQENPPDKYLNTPTVIGHGGVLIPAAMEPWDSCGGGVSDGCGHQTNPRNCDTSDNPIPCGNPTSPSVIGTNNFTPNPAYTGRKACSHPGWKAVAAFGQWPGRYGFILSGDATCCAQNPPADSPQSKYTSMEYTLAARFHASSTHNLSQSLDMSHMPPDLEPTLTAMPDQGNTEDVVSTINTDQIASVDSNGNLTHSGSMASTFTDIFSGNCWIGGDWSHPYDCSLTKKLSSNCTTDAFNVIVATYDYGSSIIPLFSIPSNIDCICGIVTLTYNNFGNLIYLSGTVDYVNEQLNLVNSGLAAACAAAEQNDVNQKQQFTAAGSCYVTLSDSKLEFICSGNNTAALQNYQAAGDSWYQTVSRTASCDFSIHITRQLSGSITFASVIADAVGLAAQYPLGDDQVYPWRTDSNVWQMPLVSMDAASTGLDVESWTVIPDDPTNNPAWNPTPMTSHNITVNGVTIPVYDTPYTYEFSGTIDWGNPATPQYSGTVRGKPQPVGNARYFNFYQPVKETCCPEMFCDSGFGEYSPAGLPKTATQWTDPQMGGSLRDGAQMIEWNGGVLLVKWAECLMSWPSVNLARPFGRDRFLIDYSTITDPNCTSGTGIASEDWIGDIVTDPTQVITGSSVNYWDHRRFPLCRSIGSTLAIVSAVQTSPGVVTLTTSETHWIMGGGSYSVADSLDCYKIPGLGLGVLVIAATPGTNTLTVSGTLATTYSSGGYIASAGITAAQAAWDSTCPRHQFLVQQWQLTLRENGGYTYDQSLQTLQPQSGYSVLCCSPNAESFPAGCAVYTAPFGSIANDVCYATGWNLKFQQYTTDPFYKAPLECQPDPSYKILLTDPSCADNSTDDRITYTPFAPLVEPMLTLPAGAPPLPVGVVLQTNFDPGSFPSPLANNCHFPNCVAQAPQIWTAYQLCTDWKVFTHDNFGKNGFQT